MYMGVKYLLHIQFNFIININCIQLLKIHDDKITKFIINLIILILINLI